MQGHTGDRSAVSLTKQSLPFLCTSFSRIYWTAFKTHELFDSHHPSKYGNDYVHALCKEKVEHKEFDHAGLWMRSCRLRKASPSTKLRPVFGYNAEGD